MKRKSCHPRRKTTKKQKKKKFKREIKGCTRGEFVEIKRELSPFYSSLIFMFTFYSWECVWWLKLCSLFFFFKPWTRFICGWVISNFDGLLTEYMSCCMFAVIFYFDNIYFYSLFRLITHLMILAKKEPHKGLS